MKNIKRIVAALLTMLLVVIMSFNVEDIGDAVPAAARPSVRLPVLMYHKVLKNRNSLGKYTVLPSELEADLIYMKEHGYTTVTVEDLVAYVYNDVSLPEKPIMLTFDDGFRSYYTYVLPLLEKYESKAVMSIIGEYVDKSSEDKNLNPYLNWSQVEELQASPYVEIQNHSYAMHKLNNRLGCTILDGESYDEYKKVIVNDVGYLQLLISGKTGYTPSAFTYPFGAMCKECKKILREMGFLASLSSTSGVNILTGDEDDLYELKRINRPSGINHDEFFKMLEEVK
jgi:peptidoglycan/xylan/chitin deacetylase (PgdA/CDA1 family)